LTRRGDFWRSDWFAGLAVVIAVVALHKTTNLVDSLERRFYDVASTSSSRQPSDRIAVIAIDDQSIANIGRWPWPRDVHAQLIDQLAAPKPRQLSTPPSSLSRRPTGVWFYSQDERSAGAGRPGRSRPRCKAVSTSSSERSSAEAEQALDTDAKLAASMSKAGNVLLPSVFLLGEPQGKPDKPLPALR
jgi:hypothetical protein